MEDKYFGLKWIVHSEIIESWPIFDFHFIRNNLRMFYDNDNKWSEIAKTVEYSTRPKDMM